MPPNEWCYIGEFIVHCLIPVSYHIMHPHDICVFLYLSDVIIVNLTRASMFICSKSVWDNMTDV